MAKTSGTVRGGNTGASRTSEAAQKAADIPLSSFDGNERDYKKVEKSIAADYDERYKKLVQRDGKKAADEQLRGTAERLLQRHEGIVSEAKEIIEKNSLQLSAAEGGLRTPNSANFYRSQIKRAKETIYKEKATYKWFSENIK